MTKDELKTILEKHAKWLAEEADGAPADLRGATLRRANLRGANLYEANLRRAILIGTNMIGIDAQIILTALGIIH